MSGMFFSFSVTYQTLLILYTTYVISAKVRAYPNNYVTMETER